MALLTGEVAVCVLDGDITQLIAPLPSSYAGMAQANAAESGGNSGESAAIEFFLAPRKKSVKEESKPWGNLHLLTFFFFKICWKLIFN